MTFRYFKNAHVSGIVQLKTVFHIMCDIIFHRCNEEFFLNRYEPKWSKPSDLEKSACRIEIKAAQPIGTVSISYVPHRIRIIVFL